MHYHRSSPSLQWISLPTILGVAFVTISLSMVAGQIQDEEPFYLEGDFIPSYGPLGSGTHSKRAIRNGHGGVGDFGDIGGGDLQSNFLDLFDWNKEMPVQGIVNTFLDNEDELPLLKELADSCSKREFYFGQNPRHMSVVMKITNLLMEQPTAQEVINMAGSLRDRDEVNVNAWLRGVMSAAIHRPDMQGLRKPAMLEVIPGMFMNNRAVAIMKRQAEYAEQSRACVPVDGSQGTDNGIENALWYWREDVMVNSHHWYWHMAYPIVSNLPRGDRRGELFFFMHHTFVARYHSERLANGLAPVPALNLQRGTIIREAYNPHLTDTNSGNNWTPRPANVPISSTRSAAIPGSPFFVSVDNRTIHLNRILESISVRSLLTGLNGVAPIINSDGIDALGDVIEASQFSINPEYYGYHGIHNTGHVLISLILDPLMRRGLPPGVMGDTATAMRDIVFYPYHTFIDDIFDSHKRTLRPYQLSAGEWPLVWAGVEITSLSVQTYDLPLNNLRTFFGEKRYELSRGLDFNRSNVQGPIWTCVKHLDHQDFQYQLTIDRKDYSRIPKATVRIFLGPRFDEKGKRYSLDEQRRRFFILDKFAVTLDVGKNTIVRNSADSTLTIDFPQSHLELQQGAAQRNPFCGCGWPHHLLLPRGTPEGMPFDLFAMVTDGSLDFVPSRGVPQQCRSAPIFCGIPGELYPDARPMNYPFDRSIYKSNNINPFDPLFDEVGGPITIEEWVSEVPNMAITPVIVSHVSDLGGGDQPLQFAGPQGNLGGEQNILGPAEPSVTVQNFGAPTDFFKEFFPSTRPGRNHPKRFAPGIQPPSKEFLNFIES